jgi:hypothetical protein
MALLWGLACFMIYVTFTVHKEPVAPWMRVFATCFFGVFGLLTTVLCVIPYYTSYSLDPENLTIRVGPITSKIPIADIIEAYPTRNPLSAPAWSLDRLRIRVSSRRFGALISPVRKREFLQELAGLAPHLYLKENGVVRGDS